MMIEEAKYRGAVIDPGREYRFWLWRSLGLEVTRACGWVLNNPSTADAEFDDATVRKAWTFSRAWGFDSMIFVNTNPFRSTDPKGARVPPANVLAANDTWLCELMKSCTTVVCGWGDKAHPALAKRAVTVLHHLGPVHALRVTKAGNPQHPLYLPGNLTPQFWNPSKWLQ